ncbi:hypothetical protein THAOC_04652 [Thalassiosira oceanica]|uniref:Uncharacterized protein n=1 Tax=Thalassiosira oceanica TaxID=159749 RepID=K0T4T2_THAOC|nr:hypothetical protein THAOC_04652 [Thalassiosira oceanica]|eukprot:EJK73708.1 hypothetical protein THAOC_04652 [Thalassiosira oceanica]
MPPSGTDGFRSGGLSRNPSLFPWFVPPGYRFDAMISYRYTMRCRFRGPWTGCALCAQSPIVSSAKADEKRTRLSEAPISGHRTLDDVRRGQESRSTDTKKPSVPLYSTIPHPTRKQNNSHRTFEVVEVAPCASPCSPSSSHPRRKRRPTSTGQVSVAVPWDWVPAELSLARRRSLSTLDTAINVPRLTRRVLSLFSGTAMHRGLGPIA